MGFQREFATSPQALEDNIQSMAYIVFQSNFFKVRFDFQWNIYEANGFQRKYASATVMY